MVVSILLPPMPQLVADFAAYLRQERMRGTGTIKRYTGIVEEFALFLDNLTKDNIGLGLETVDKHHLIQFLRRNDEAEPSRALWNIRLAALRAFYDYLYKVGIVMTNPAMRIDRLKTNPRQPVPLSLDELLAVIDAIEQEAGLYRSRNTAIIQVFFHCALRVAELVSLNMDQVDFQNYLFTNIRTKGGKWISLPFNDLVAACLEQYLRQRKPVEGQTALFLSNRGQRLSIRAVEELVKTYAMKAGISRPVGPHLLRHSGATELADLGTPLHVVQEICGHASVTTTQHYVHAKGNARRKAIDALGKEVSKRAKQRRKERTIQREIGITRNR